VTGGSLLRRTLLSITGFGLGSLLIAGTLSLVFVGIAESVLPTSPEHEDGAAIEEPAAARPPAERDALADRRRDGVPSRRRAPRAQLPKKTKATASERPL
jgi:hypothetical protein